MKKPRKWKMWALMPNDGEEGYFDVYFYRPHAERVMAPYEKIIRVEVRELPKRKPR